MYNLQLYTEMKYYVHPKITTIIYKLETQSLTKFAQWSTPIILYWYFFLQAVFKLHFFHKVKWCENRDGGCHHRPNKHYMIVVRVNMKTVTDEFDCLTLEKSTFF